MQRLRLRPDDMVRVSALAGLLGCIVFGPAAATHGLAETPSCATPARLMARVELLFGTAREQGRSLTPAQWRAFVDEEVTPRFPEGLTELAGRGQWRGPDGVITHESARVLLIWYTPGAERERDIETVRERYKQRFGQRSVMRVDGQDCVSF